MKKMAVRVAVVLAALIVLFLAGPKPEVDLQLKSLDISTDLDQYLSQSEAKYTDIVPGTEKTIIWANDSKTKTSLSIVYLHGFSATRQEVAPLCDEAAAELGANLFYTRLSGHGRSNAAMAEPTINDWLNDTNEALEIGKRLGDKVVVIGTSTGGTLATWLAEQPDTEDVLGYVLISPNFGPYDSNSEILTLPWAKQFVPLLIGNEYSWTPTNPDHGRYWTHSYPSPALVPMMGLVNYVRKSDLESIQKPFLIIYSPDDTVANSEKTGLIIEKIGSEIKQVERITYPVNPENHVLAGDILAPDNTQAIKDIILDFISRLR